MGRPPGLELDAVFFRIPHTNAIFELVHFRGVDQATVVAGNADIGATHFGFAVDDIEATVARLGLEVSGTRSISPIGPYRGGRSVYLKDPDGANIQLMQLAGRPGRMPSCDQAIRADLGRHLPGKRWVHPTRTPHPACVGIGTGGTPGGILPPLGS